MPLTLEVIAGNENHQLIAAIGGAGNCLIVRESWITETNQIKGFDSYAQFGYGEGFEWVRCDFEGANIEVAHIPAHSANKDFPTELAVLQDCHLIIFSDIGATTFLLLQW